jgi:hypothetical protein
MHGGMPQLKELKHFFKDLKIEYRVENKPKRKVIRSLLPNTG